MCARAEVYVWHDASGRVHMTDDLAQVPPAQRPAAARSAAEAARAAAVRTDTSGADAGVPALARPAKPRARPAAPARSATSAATASRSAKSPAAPRRHVLQVEVAGSVMRVQAEVDGAMVPFVLDTGASICTIPRWALEPMGVELDADTAMIPVAGISGQAQLVPEIRVERVRIGEAEVGNLHMAVLDTMDEGLLGMPFFNHFKVSTDPAAGTLVLEEIDLDQVAGVAGGLNENAWRSRFRMRRAALEHIRAALEKLPSESLAPRRDLEAQETYWERQLELLDQEASEAEVPYSWRE
jgi:clan AA aspartic protease (TIGR02281 family)